jgi:hypothetical protein
VIDRAPTSLLAPAGLIAGFGVAVQSGSRALGGIVLAAFAAACIYVWSRREDRRTVALLTVIGFAAFALSHLLGLVTGAWPAVLIVSGVTGWACWRLSDSRHPS